MNDAFLAMLIVQLISFVILVGSVILHEVAHGWVADLLGDPTARLAKRLTLNPKKHIDLWMTIILPLFLLLSRSSVIFGAAKPVPVDPFNFRDPKKDMALTALAGPVTNLAIAIFFAVLFRLLENFLGFGVISVLFESICKTAIYTNVTLAIFNLFPLPPLDGFKVLAGVLSDNLANEMYRLEKYGIFIVFFVLMAFPQVIFGFVSPISQTIIKLLLP